MKLVLETIMLFVQDVDMLKAFYIDTLQLSLVEEIQSEWVLLSAGAGQVALHKIGQGYLVSHDEPFKVENIVKMVFQTDEDIFEIRERLASRQVAIGEVKTFDNHGFWLCDGEDPEGNVFQLKQKKG